MQWSTITWTHAGTVDLAQRYALDGWDVYADLDLAVIETPAGSVRLDPSVPTTPPGTGHIPPHSGARVTAVYEITYDAWGNPTFRRIQ